MLSNITGSDVRRWSCLTIEAAQKSASPVDESSTMIRAEQLRLLVRACRLHICALWLTDTSADLYEPFMC
jgi:hypothetical protein